ncbi:MAG: acetyl-CoA carboxylase, biotin carboxyl carrier protein, partial [Clostridiales bacterium]|nr:acetyl-CoA carboxylase, biotin carboxyl carrier protein [Clostridiales bacterium]
AAPSPDAAPFVQAGDRVKKGETLCVIEAMKVMNELTADADGEVEAVLAENGQIVEYGQPLFRLKD